MAASHCPYCAFQCGTQLTPRSDGGVAIEGDRNFPVNRGALCIKGWTASDTLTHRDRLRTPLVRDRHGALVPATWTEALAKIGERIASVQARRGRDAVALFGGGGLTNEKAYLLGKLARVALRTRNVDYNGRFCMASAAAAGLRALGVDRGLPFPIDDIARTDVLLLVGANVAETMPPFMQWVEEQRANGGTLIVADPRKTPTAAAATLHLPLLPGSDAALANGLLHLLLRENRVDHEYVRERTERFDEVRALVAGYWPERVERLTGVPEAKLLETARKLGRAQRPMILTARGPEQQSNGVANVLAFINVALALGAVGRPGAGWGSITGQGNGQGGREHGQKADQLPGYRRLDDPDARAHVAKVWDVDPRSLPGPGKSAQELLMSLGEEIAALIVMGSNVVVSAPDTNAVEKKLRALELLVVVDTFLSETAALADVVLPTAQWAEETGTLTNLEGRVLLRQKALDPPAGVRTDLEILCDIARAVGEGARFSYQGPEEVFAELGRATAGGVADYSGITYEKIRTNAGVHWPCPDLAHPGTPRLFAERFPTPSGRARFHAIHHAPPAEEPDVEYPLWLTTGRVLAQYQSGTQTRRVGRLRELAPEPFVEMHPQTARRYGIVDRVQLETRRGSAIFAARITDSIRSDVVFVPFHWVGANKLTNPALDPISRMPEFKACAVRISPVRGTS
ncbi:MAG: molybdopterin oxidoreductase family protein [Polyangiales bacterium]